MDKIIIGAIFIILLLFVLIAMIIFILPYLPALIGECREAIQEIKDALKKEEE